MRAAKIIITFLLSGLIIWGSTAVITASRMVTNQEILEQFTWTLRTGDGNDQQATFTNTTITVAAQSYDYALNRNHLEITIGPFKGQYILNQDGTDYNLKNTDDDDTPQNIYLIRN